jgi:hypothetical protein
MQEVIQIHDTRLHRFQLVLRSRREIHKPVFFLIRRNCKAIFDLFRVSIKGAEPVKVGLGLIYA